MSFTEVSTSFLMGRVTCPLPLPEPGQNTFTNSGSFLLQVKTLS